MEYWSGGVMGVDAAEGALFQSSYGFSRIIQHLLRSLAPKASVRLKP